MNELERSVICKVAGVVGKVIKECEEHIFQGFEHETDKIEYDCFDMAFLQQWGEYPRRMRTTCARCGEIMRTRVYWTNGSWSIISMPSRRCRL